MFAPYYFPNMPIRLHPNNPYFLELDNNELWAAEVKKNGWRCLTYINDNILFYNRHNRLITENFTSLRKSLKDIPPKTILDGEILNFRTKDVKEKLYLFDVIMWDGKLLASQPYIERIKYLKNIPTSEHVEIAEQFYKNKVRLFYDSINSQLLEGIVLKRIDSKYMISTSKSLKNVLWLKVKKIEDHVKSTKNRFLKLK